MWPHWCCSEAKSFVFLVEFLTVSQESVDGSAHSLVENVQMGALRQMT